MPPKSLMSGESAIVNLLALGLFKPKPAQRYDARAKEKSAKEKSGSRPEARRGEDEFRR
jgi:hypothetical protein